MKIRFLTVGKLKEKWLKDGFAEYRKRISRFAAVEVIEVPDVPDQQSAEAAVRQEGEALLRQWPADGMVVAVDLHGRAYDSEAFAVQLERWLEQGGSHLTFVIAGSNGFSPAVLARAGARISLSPLTFPHQLTRLILAEQVFRACKINRNETYHK